SHELRTPLTVIHGYLEILLSQTQDSSPQYQTIFEEMYQQTTRMENLVENLLLLARLENDEAMSEIQSEVNVAQLLTRICQEAEQLSGKAKHHITLKADENLKLLGVEDELRSLFSNIIFNAVKYTPANGTIQVEWFSKKDKAYFAVTDSGIGIAAKDIPRITERFYRVDKARSRASGGTGLGLAIAKHVLLRHNGQLDIESKLAEGTRFCCIFPKMRIVN
ncbi:MAG TPA: ATP-binding protein, partial [Coxiellaceae bacterium]|nr:ATP-binding protein [Coxiellaceae bacterium]